MSLGACSSGSEGGDHEESNGGGGVVGGAAVVVVWGWQPAAAIEKEEGIYFGEDNEMRCWCVGLG